MVMMVMVMDHAHPMMAHHVMALVMARMVVVVVVMAVLVMMQMSMVSHHVMLSRSFDLRSRFRKCGDWSG